MRPSSLGGGRILRRTLSVRLSVRPVSGCTLFSVTPSYDERTSKIEKLRFSLMGQRHVCTFRHAQRAAYRTAISAAQILVRNCFSLPKLFYTLRSVPCLIASTELVHYDTLIRQTLLQILNIQFGDETWQQSIASIIRWTWSEISDRSGTADVPCICHGVSRFYISAVAFSSTSRYRSSSHQCA